ncbi:helicase HerA domain-containing protein, partial [Spiroplasma sp. AdecLV25b]|uniref:helicase HerA domain-containing protein n=1 Tax=Spiroplasma sp. AdecLV25b TaxID=3027162 RepID=UPI0027E1CCB9
MPNKIWIKISIKAFVFLIFFILFWMIIAVIYSFFVLKDISVDNWMVALKMKYNLWYSFLITILTLVGYLVFLIHLKIKNKGNCKTKINKNKNSIMRELKIIDRKNIIFLNKKIGLISEKLKQHTLIVGGTGYGKTTTALTIISQLKNKLNQKIIIIDGKGDEDLIDKIKTIDNNAFIWSIGCDNVYNPLATKNNVILADKIMSLFNFSEAHYQAIAHNYLLLLIKILINKSIPITFENIVKYFPIKQLKKLVDKHENEYDVLKSFIENEHDIKGLQHRLNVYLQQLNTSLGNDNSLGNLIAKHNIILFSLNSFKYPELASNVGKLII